MNRNLAPLLAVVCLVGEGWCHDSDQPSAESLWQSESFRRSFAASYGVDARIEPKVSSAEKTVLDAVAQRMVAGDREGAAERLLSAPDANQSAALIFALGNIRFEQGRVDDAVENFERALELYPNFRDAHRNLAVARVQQDEFDRAKPHLVRALELGARDGLTLGLLGYCHASEGHYQAALQAYRLAQLTMPEEEQWKLGEAHALKHLDDAFASAEIYRELLAARESDASLWLGQADAYLQLGLTDEGIGNLEVVRRLGRLSSGETVTLGQLYLSQGLVASAVGCFRESLEAETPPPANSVVDALENLVHGRHWSEAQAFVEAIEAKPVYAGLVGEVPADGDAKALSGLRSRLTRARAFLELETGDAEAGAARVEALLAEDPLDGVALLLLGKLRQQEARPEEAALLFERATREPATEVRAWRAWGELLVGQGRFVQALKPLRRALELEEDLLLEAYVEAVQRAAGGEG